MPEVLRTQDNIAVSAAEAVTLFDPPIDGILVVSAGTSVVATMGGEAVSMDLSQGPISEPRGMFGPGAVVPLPGCTKITGTGVSFVAYRRRRFGVPTNDVIE